MPRPAQIYLQLPNLVTLSLSMLLCLSLSRSLRSLSLSLSRSLARSRDLSLATRARTHTLSFFFPLQLTHSLSFFQPVTHTLSPPIHAHSHTHTPAGSKRRSILVAFGQSKIISQCCSQLFDFFLTTWRSSQATNLSDLIRINRRNEPMPVHWFRGLN